jgi:dimethylargininase
VSTFVLPDRVILRDLSARYADCLRSDASVPIDVALARAQHGGYASAIRAAGARIEVLAGDDSCPDACFIEDTTVITGAHALATRPGAEARRAEVEPVATALSRHLTVHRMAAPATLDGGDVLRVGSRLFVGLSARTNEAGAEALARVAALDGLEVIRVPVRGGLHLKSACSLASASILVYDPSVLGDAELARFRAPDLELLPSAEPAGANVLALGDAVLVSMAAPKTVTELWARRLDVRVVDVSEIHKGDGALTCLSLRVPRAGAWCT